MADQEPVPERMLTEAEFNEAMKDPECFELQVDAWRRMVQGEFGEIPAEVRERLEAALQNVEKQATISLAAGKLRALMHVMQRPGGEMQDEDRLAQCQALTEEVTDALLSLPEPYRTEFMKDFVPLRDRVRALRIDN